MASMSTGRTLVGRLGRQALSSASSRRIGATSTQQSSARASNGQCCDPFTPTASSGSAVASTSRSFSSSCASRQTQSVGSPAPAVHLPTLAGKDPKLYQSVRPAPRSAYVALAHRLKLIVGETDLETKAQRVALLIQACTHPTFASLLDRARASINAADSINDVSGLGRGVVRSSSEDGKLENELRALDAQYISIAAESHNASMAALGNSLMGLIASEYLHLRYPNLPNRVLKAALSAYVGPSTLSDVAAELGIAAQGMIRWDRDALVAQTKGPSKRLMSRDALADAMRAVVALIFQEQGLASARKFVHAQLLTRLVPIVELLKFSNPKRGLSELTKKLGKERPQSKLIAESGRLSINPLFVVGVWSGQEKLGEGTGHAIRLAEFRAAEDALRRFYLSETPAARISLPSITLDGELSAAADESVSGSQGEFGFGDIWSVDKPASSNVADVASSFQPGRLGASEVIFGTKA